MELLLLLHSPIVFFHSPMMNREKCPTRMKAQAGLAPIQCPIRKPRVRIVEVRKIWEAIESAVGGSVSRRPGGAANDSAVT
jgi:hypothetical protein